MAQPDLFNSQEKKTRLKSATDNQSATHNHLIATKHLPAACAGVAMVALLLGLGSCSKHKQNPAVTASNESASAAPMVRETPPPKTTTTAPAAKKLRKPRRTTATYVNQSYGVSFTYPKKYALKVGDEALLTWDGTRPVASGFRKSGGITVAAVVLPVALYPDTDLHSAFVGLNVNRNLTPSECEQFATSEAKSPEPAQPSPIKLGAIQFSEREDLDGGNFEQADTKYYHVFRNDVCYEFALGVGTARDGEDDVKPQVDRTEVFQRLEKILASVEIKPAARAAAEASVDSKNNEPVVSAPAPVVSSDKL
jgi:hypothetical protein